MPHFTSALFMFFLFHLCRIISCPSAPPQAPSPDEYHKETVRLVKRLHQWDVMRANKAPFSFGIEARVPFLDKEFLQLAMNINPREKMVRKNTDLLMNNRQMLSTHTQVSTGDSPMCVYCAFCVQVDSLPTL